MHHRHYKSPLRRALYSFILIVSVLSLGTYGMHRFEHLPFLKAFYFMSMIATAQGPTYAPATTAGMLFASLMAFLSVGVITAALAFLFGPFFGKLWKIGVVHFEEEVQKFKK